MQVFSKSSAWLCGIDEAIAVLKLVGYDWSALEVHALYDGDAVSPHETVMTIKGPAIAALPLANLSGDAEYDLFARGISDQLGAALTRFKGVRVLSPRADRWIHVDRMKSSALDVRREIEAWFQAEGRRSACLESGCGRLMHCP